MNDFVR